MKNKQIVFGTLISYFAIAFSILSGLIYTPWMIRMIGDDHYALYTLAISVINLFLLDFGIGSSVTRFLSNYYAKGQYYEAKCFMGIVYKVFFAISFVVAVCLGIVYCNIDVIYSKLLPAEIVVFKRLFLIVAAYSVLSFPFTTFNGVLMANEKFIALKLCNLGQKVLNVTCVVVLLLLGQGVYALVLVHAISNAVFLLIKYIVIKTDTKQTTNLLSWDRTIAKSLFGYSAWITIVNLAQRCIFSIMPTIIAALVGTSEVVIFSLASTLEGYVYLFSDAVNGMFMPKITRLLVNNDAESGLSKLMSKVGQYHVWTIGLIIIGFLAFGKDFVVCWVGNEYKDVYWCTVFLLLPSLIDVPQQVARTALLAKDIVKEQAFVYMGMALLNILMSFLLIPLMGVIGAAITICVAYLFRTAGMNVLYIKSLHIDLKLFFKKTYGRWIIYAAITILFGYTVDCLVCLDGWIGLAIKCLLICVCYLLFFYIDCKLNKEKNYEVY